MNAKKLEDRIIAYAYGDVSPVEAAELEIKMATCAKLRSLYEEHSSIKKNLCMLPCPPPHQLSTERLRHIVLNRQQTVRSKPDLSLVWMAAGVAVCSFLVGSWWSTNRPKSEPHFVGSNKSVAENTTGLNLDAPFSAFGAWPTSSVANTKEKKPNSVQKAKADPAQFRPVNEAATSLASMKQPEVKSQSPTTSSPPADQAYFPPFSLAMLSTGLSSRSGFNRGLFALKNASNGFVGASPEAGTRAPVSNGGQEFARRTGAVKSTSQPRLVTITNDTDDATGLSKAKEVGDTSDVQLGG